MSDYFKIFIPSWERKCIFLLRNSNTSVSYIAGSMCQFFRWGQLDFSFNFEHNKWISRVFNSTLRDISSNIVGTSVECTYKYVARERACLDWLCNVYSHLRIPYNNFLDLEVFCEQYINRLTVNILTKKGMRKDANIHDFSEFEETYNSNRCLSINSSPPLSVFSTASVAAAAQCSSFTSPLSSLFSTSVADSTSMRLPTVHVCEFGAQTSVDTTDGCIQTDQETTECAICSLAISNSEYDRHIYDCRRKRLIKCAICKVMVEFYNYEQHILGCGESIPRCTVCFERYEFDTTIRVFRCGHHCCNDCLAGIINASEGHEFNCHMCRKVFKKNGLRMNIFNIHLY